MACKGCGQQATGTKLGPCRTFTFPLGDGEVEIVFRGPISKEALGPLPVIVDFVAHMMAGLVPTGAEVEAQIAAQELGNFVGVRNG